MVRPHPSYARWLRAHARPRHACSCRSITISAPGAARDEPPSQSVIGLGPPTPAAFRKIDGDPDRPGQSTSAEGGSSSGATSPSSSSSSSNSPGEVLLGIPYPNLSGEQGQEHTDESSSSEEPQTAVARVPLPNPFIVPVRRLRQPFDTHAFVSRLEEATLSPETSKALMETVRGLVLQRTDRAANNMLSREELDNEAYLFKAALSKLRTEFNVRNRNTGIAARNAVSALRHELDSVEVKMAEDVQVLKHDIELDVNNRKTDTRSDMKWADIAIEEINNRATISIGDLKTEIESAKWEATRRAIAIIVVLVVSGVAISTFAIGPDATQTQTQPPPAAPVEPPPAAKMRDIGIGTDEDPFDYEAKIDKLLSEVERAERKEPRRDRRPRADSLPERRPRSEFLPDRVDRI